METLTDKNKQLRHSFDSLFKGMSSIFNLFGDIPVNIIEYNFKSDSESLAQDWINVGNYFKKSIIIYENNGKKHKNSELAKSN